MVYGFLFLAWPPLLFISSKIAGIQEASSLWVPFLIFIPPIIASILFSLFKKPIIILTKKDITLHGIQFTEDIVQGFQVFLFHFVVLFKNGSKEVVNTAFTGWSSEDILNTLDTLYPNKTHNNDITHQYRRVASSVFFGIMCISIIISITTILFSIHKVSTSEKVKGTFSFSFIETNVCNRISCHHTVNVFLVPTMRGETKEYHTSDYFFLNDYKVGDIETFYSDKEGNINDIQSLTYPPLLLLILSGLYLLLYIRLKSFKGASNLPVSKL